MMRKSAICLALALTAILPYSGAAIGAQKPTDRQMHLAQKWAANNALFVLYHEIAHLLVDQFDLPVLGKQEDAADHLASYILLNRQTVEADQAIADAAKGWLLFGEAYGKELEDSDYYGEHSLDRQRAYQIVCLMVGSNDKTFDEIADNYRMDEDRQERCGADYAMVERSAESLLGQYWRKDGPKTKVKITYMPAPAKLKRAAAAFKSSGVFEQVAEELETNYSLRRSISFQAESCDDANAFYDPDSVKVTFCYELMEDFISLIAEDMPEESDPAKRNVASGRAEAASF